MLFKKYGTGKYLHRIDSVEYLHKSDYKNEYWPFIHDEVAYYYTTESGYNTASPSDIVEVDESELVHCFGRLYKWKEM